jgi:hypothetical protein
MQLSRKNKLKNLENVLIMYDKAINSTNIQQKKPSKKPKALKNKKAQRKKSKGFLCKIGHRPTLPPVTAVPLALAGLTSLFGMGRGGHRRYRHLNIIRLHKAILDEY